MKQKSKVQRECHLDRCWDARCFDRDRNACGFPYIRRLQRGSRWEGGLCIWRGRKSTFSLSLSHQISISHISAAIFLNKQRVSITSAPQLEYLSVNQMLLLYPRNLWRVKANIFVVMTWLIIHCKIGATALLPLLSLILVHNLTAQMLPAQEHPDVPAHFQAVLKRSVCHA